jgi:predicted metalloprotease
MRWQMGRRSDNIEDRRGMGAGGIAVGGGIGTIVVVVLALFFGVDPSVVLQGGGSPAPPAVERRPPPPEQDQLKDFVAAVLGDTEDTWREVFARMKREYREPKLVLFSDVVQSSCGTAQSAVGPFYCPSDQKVYLDLSFFRDLREGFRAPGEFAQAYVIAHEIGHHVQKVTGTSDKVDQLTRQNPGDANELSVRLELQADCYAGVWASTVFAQGDLEKGDLDEAFTATEAVGDDRLQGQAGGRVNPDSFTHGTSEQRHEWFEAGYESGKPAACDTFSTDSL